MSSKTFEQIMHDILAFEEKPRKIEKNYDKSRNVNSETCKSCGGRCCKACGCHFSPDDFEEISFDYLKKQIEEKEYISIDYVDREMLMEDSGVFILRARNSGAPIVDLGYKRSPCSLFTDNGCKLSYEERPSGGKLLVPYHSFSLFIDSDCVQTYPIKDCCYEWRPYQEIIMQLIQAFKS